MPTETYTITRRPAWSFLGEIKVEIECDPFASSFVKLGLAVKAAFRSGARLDGARLDGASLDGARLDGARLDGASLVGASLDGASLVGANLVGARLDGASLVGANLVGANLVGARLDGASLVGANLVGANLVGASLVGASLVGASLDGALVRGEKVRRLFACVGRIKDPYVFYAFELQDGSVKILAGCRWLTPTAYRAHVAKSYPHTTKATETLAVIGFVEQRMADLGIGLAAETSPKLKRSRKAKAEGQVEAAA